MWSYGKNEFLKHKKLKTRFPTVKKKFLKFWISGWIQDQKYYKNPSEAKKKFFDRGKTKVEITESHS